MNEEEYNKIFPVGTVIIPNIFCQNSFTMNLDLNDNMIQMCIHEQLKELNDNCYKSEWVYDERIRAMVRIGDK